MIFDSQQVKDILDVAYEDFLNGLLAAPIHMDEEMNLCFVTINDLYLRAIRNMGDDIVVKESLEGSCQELVRLRNFLPEEPTAILAVAQFYGQLQTALLVIG